MTVRIVVDGGEVWGGPTSDVESARKEARLVSRLRGKRVQVIEEASGRVLQTCLSSGPSSAALAGSWLTRALRHAEGDAPCGMGVAPCLRLDQAQTIEEAARYYGVSVEAVVRVAIEVGLSRLGTDA